MIPYILYASLILSACLIFYKLMLQKETFFQLNRLILLTCMVLAFILPSLHVPQEMSFRKVPAVINSSAETSLNHDYIARPEHENTLPTVEPVQKNQGIDFEQVKQWLIYLYWFGVAILGLNFLMQMGLLFYTAYSRPVIKDGKFRIVEITGDKAPCSFGNNIFINPSKYDWETYNRVLLHEKIHIEQKHTFDLLLAEIVLAFQWFNPFAWIWRKELESNLEFYTDNKFLLRDATEKESYQLSLVKVAAPHFPLSLTTNYNQSLLKKRLLMMNSKKSNVHTIWKYFFLIPLMVLFVCMFNDTIVKSQSVVTKASGKAQKHIAHDIKTEGKWFATINGDHVNIQFKSDDQKYNESSNGSTFLLSEFNNLPRGKEGAFALTREAGTMNFTGKFDGDKGMGEYKFSPDKVYGDNMKKEGINLSTDEDVMVFFFVNVKRSYVQMLKQNGYTDLDKEKLIPLAALDVNEAYIKSIKDAGFTNISLDNLVPFKALNVDKPYIEEIHKAGYNNISPDKVIAFKAQGIDGKYIADYHNSIKKEKNEKNDEARELNEKNNNNQDAHNNNAEKNDARAYDRMKNEKDGKNDDDNLIAFKALNIDDAFINSFKNAGYDNLSKSDLISMKALGITPEFIKSFNDAGYKNLKPDELFSLKSQNITPSIIKQYKDLGFADIDIEDIVSLKALDVNSDFVKSFRSAGYTNVKVDELVALKSQNVTPALVKQYKDLGFDNVSLDDVIGAKATGTSPSFIKSMREKGHNMKSLDKYIALKSVLGE